MSPPGPPLTPEEVEHYRSLVPVLRDGREVCPVCEQPVWTADLPVDVTACLPSTCRAWSCVGVWDREQREFVPEEL